MPNVAFKRKELTDALDKWGIVRDCLAGEKQIKFRKEKYLPAPDASANATEKVQRYNAYLTRANFYNVTGRTLNGLVGQVFTKEPSIELPPELEFFENFFSTFGTRFGTPSWHQICPSSNKMSPREPSGASKT